MASHLSKFWMDHVREAQRELGRVEERIKILNRCRAREYERLQRAGRHNEAAAAYDEMTRQEKSLLSEQARIQRQIDDFQRRV